MRVICLDTLDHVAQWISNYIVFQINVARPTHDHPFVLGLSTDSTLIKTYEKLIHMYQSGQVSFKHVMIFIINEYLGVPKNNSNNYFTFVYKNFINFIDIKQENVNFLHGNTNDVNYEYQQYEKRIKSFGGIHLLLGSIGDNGHFAFNEPGSSLNSSTKIKRLSYETRASNARFFNNNINCVPTHALTIGIATLFESREIIIIATGLDKATAVQASIEGGISHMCPVSYLQLHTQSILVCDELSIMELKVKTVKYFQELEINK